MMVRAPGPRKSTCLLTLCVLAAALLLPPIAGADAPIVLEDDGATDAPGGRNEDHAPIRIQSDAALLLPDAVAGNGVRGGTGAPDDPFVISEWRIRARDATAITIEHVDAHVIVKDVKIEGGGSLAIYVGDSTNLTLQDVNATDWQGPAVGLHDSRVAILGGHYFAPKPHNEKSTVLTARSSVLDVDGARITGGWTGLVLHNSGGTLRNLTTQVNGSYGLQTVHQPNEPFPLGARTLIIETSTFQGPPPRYINPHYPSYGGTGILLTNTHYDHQVIRGNTFTSLADGARQSFGWGDGRPPANVTIQDNAFVGTGIGLSLGGVARADEVAVMGNLFGKNFFGLSTGDSDSVVTRNRFHANYDAILLHGLDGEGAAYHLTIRRNAFSASKESAVWGQISTASHFGVVDARYNWWGSPDGPKVGGYGDPDEREAVPPEVRYEPWLRAPPDGLPALPEGFADVPGPGPVSIPWGKRIADSIPGPGAAWALAAGMGAVVLLDRRQGKRRG